MQHTGIEVQGAAIHAEGVDRFKHKQEGLSVVFEPWTLSDEVENAGFFGVGSLSEMERVFWVFYMLIIACYILYILV